MGKRAAALVALCMVLVLAFATGCTARSDATASRSASQELLAVSDAAQDSLFAEPSRDTSAKADSSTSADAIAADLRAALGVTQDYRDSFDHGPKPAECQRYIVLHDTEGEGAASGVIDYWDGNGRGVAAHFVINKDGSIWQCVSLDRIAHHAGFGDTGHNQEFGVQEDGRDDMAGTSPIGDWASDYGMNAWSIGIELVHVGGSGDYPEDQLDALDDLIAYIDAYYGFESEIIDHKAWRSGNSDTSPEFARYLVNYQGHRTHS